MPARATAESRDGRIARGKNRHQSPRPARKASLHRNRQGAQRAGRDGRAGGENNLAARAQAGTRLRRRRAYVRGARRLYSQGRRRVRGDAQSGRGAAPAPGGLLPARAQRRRCGARDARVSAGAAALWLVKSIYQRQQTIFKVATSIVKFQRAFFDHGISLLKPLVLKDVAEDIGMHESTISRATANKYAHTPQGIYELKFFFTSGVKGAGGEDVSAETVKEQIRGMVTSETPQSPLSDQAIAEMLRAKQINIARRTVAKYRQAMGIPPSANRKQIG